MAAIYIELIQTIDHPAEQVFAALVDFNRHPQWIEEVEETTIPPEQPLQVGRTFEQRAKYFGRTVTIHMTIVGYEPNRLLKLESEGALPTLTSWWLEPHGSSTDVNFEFEAHPGEMYDMISAGLEGQIKRGLQAQLLGLKALVDREAS